MKRLHVELSKVQRGAWERSFPTLINDETRSRRYNSSAESIDNAKAYELQEAIEGYPSSLRLNLMNPLSFHSAWVLISNKHLNQFVVPLISPRQW